MRKTQISEMQARILQKYYDGESNFFERIWAKHQVRTKQEAQAFLDGLKSLSKHSREEFSMDKVKVDLWTRISNRIEQEERAELFLGKRGTVTEERVPFWSMILARPAWGISAGALALATLFVVFSSTSSLRSSGNLASVGGEGNQLVKYETPKIIDRDLPSAVEVDWVRSEGKVSVMSARNKRGPVIWVRRPAPRGTFGGRND